MKANFNPTGSVAKPPRKGDFLMSKGYKANKKYRKKYPERRNKERQRNYSSTAGPALNYNHRALWTVVKLFWLSLPGHTDRELHTIIGRSVAAIQNQRYKLKKEDCPSLCEV